MLCLMHEKITKTNNQNTKKRNCQSLFLRNPSYDPSDYFYYLDLLPVSYSDLPLCSYSEVFTFTFTVETSSRYQAHVDGYLLNYFFP